MPPIAGGPRVSGVHMWVGIAVLGTNALAGGWGAISWVRGFASSPFWWMLRAAQVAVAIQVAIGMYLVARGASSPDGLHIAYGISPLVVTLISEGMRAGAAQRELEEVPDLDALDR
ncbi:MAG: hypothetical protein H0T19_01275, partial [Thermoleophilaceae bacterium]|nr:hypothetical protein [Thermoleophilaceae bacterium]